MTGWLAGRPWLVLVFLAATAGALGTALLLPALRRSGASNASRYEAALRAHVRLMITLGLACAAICVAVDGLAVASGPLHAAYHARLFPWRDYVALRAGTVDVAWLTLVFGVVPFAVAGSTLRLAAPDRNASATSGLAAEGALPWARGLLRVLLVGLGALVLLATAYLPVLRGPGAAVMPAFVWGGAVSAFWLLAGMLLSRGEAEVRTPVIEATPVPPLVLDRLAWERRLNAAGLSLERQVFGDPPILAEAPVEGDTGAVPLREHDAGVAAPSGPADRTWSALGLTAWLHQHAFVTGVVGHLAARDADDTLLLHTAPGSGRTTAVLAAAREAWLEHRVRTLVLCPSALRARTIRHVAAFRQLQREDLAVVQELPDATRLAPIVVAPVEWLARTLQREHDRDVLLDGLGLLVIDDADVLSGVLATNTTMLLRRVRHLLDEGQQPVCAVVLGTSPAAASGSLEFAQRLCGTSRLSPVAIADTAPRKKLHGYRLARAGGYVDVGSDPMPGLQQTTVFSRKFGAPTAFLPQCSLSERQKQLPSWALLGPGVEDDAPLEHAWVQVREVMVGGILSLEQRVAHGGMLRADEVDHLVVLEPAVDQAGIVDWLLRAWLRSSDRHAQPDLWRSELHPLGTRLVCGLPARSVLEHHVQAALAERPSTRERLRAAFLHLDERLDEALSVLLSDGRVRARRRRTLDASGQILEEEVLAAVVSTVGGDLRSPLEGTGEPWVRVVATETSRGTTLARVPLSLAARACYPGRVFVIEREDQGTGRLVHDRWIVEDWTERTKPSDLREVRCQRTEMAVVTVPVVHRTVTTAAPPERHHRFVPDEGAGFAWWRAEVDLVEKHEGYVDYGTGIDGGRLPGDLHEPSEGYVWKGSADAVVVALDAVELSADERATLAAMLRGALRALVLVEAHTLEVLVVERLGGLATADHAEAPGLLLLDPLGGGTGLLDALARTPASAVAALLRLVWLWCDDIVTTGEAVSWDDLQPELPGRDRKALTPSPAGVCAHLARVLGHRARHPSSVPPTLLPPAALTEPDESDTHDDSACAACQGALGSRWYTWPHAPERRFCATCRNDRAICDFCAMPAGPSPRAYPDGRSQCAPCSATAVVDATDLPTLEARARELLTPLGLCPTRTCPVRLVSAMDLAARCRRSYRPSRAFDPRTIGLCTTPVRASGEPPAVEASCEIHLEDGHPEVATVATLVHELVHLWQYDHFPGGDVDRRWVEGLAVWADHKALKALGAHLDAQREAIRDDSVYGEGFRRVLAVEQQVGLAGVAAEVVRRAGEP